MTPEQRIQRSIVRRALSRGWECIRLNLFQPAGEVRLTAAQAAQLNAIRTGPASGIQWHAGTYVRHVKLPESSRGVPDLLCVHPDHPPVLVEVKTARGRLSPDQQGWHARYSNCSHVARAAEEVDAWLV